MRGFVAAVFVALLATISAVADEKRAFDEYGAPTELKGQVKVYVDAGLDIDARANFIETVRQKLPKDMPLTFLDSADGAEVGVVLTFEQQNGNVYASMIVVWVKPDGKLRLLMNERDQKTSRLTKRCSTVFGERFAAAYRKANTP
jgi:hypothetical protein